MVQEKQFKFRRNDGELDGAETYELVGSYLLSQLPPKYRNNIGLFRDDGLGALDGSPRTFENIKKDISKVFTANYVQVRTANIFTRCFMFET